jgi:hypothetical protein
MKKLYIAVLVLTASVSAFSQTRTVTNEDLEKYRKERVESERKLKERYNEMGFPSPEELERRNAQRRAEMEQYSDQLRTERLESQNDLIAEANNLRVQLASVDAQIDYLRRQGNGPYNQNFVYSYGYAPYGGYANNRWRGGNSSALAQVRRMPPNMRTVQEYALMSPTTQRLFNNNSANVRIRTGGGYVGGRINYRSGGGYRGGYIAPVIAGGNYNSNNAGDRLVFLEQTKAGLLAQWTILEEKARRAGIRLD